MKKGGHPKEIRKILNKQKMNSKMVDLNPTMPIITLKVNILNTKFENIDFFFHRHNNIPSKRNSL